MMFGEGFFTGATLSTLATWRPRWVAIFDDDSICATDRRTEPAGCSS